MSSKIVRVLDLKSPAPQKIYTVQAFKGADGSDYVHATAANGEILFCTQVYDSASNATRAAQALCDAKLVFKPRKKTRGGK